jgi:hypothetical protein
MTVDGSNPRGLQERRVTMRNPLKKKIVMVVTLDAREEEEEEAKCESS